MLLFEIQVLSTFGNSGEMFQCRILNMDLGLVDCYTCGGPGVSPELFASMYIQKNTCSLWMKYGNMDTGSVVVN